jgi:glycosyltransferase involved in cell wall biosynthesis
VVIGSFAMGSPGATPGYATLICETLEIVARASQRPIHFLGFGRGMLEAEHYFRRGLSGTSITFEVHGLCGEAEAAAFLRRCHVYLFVRAALSTQRTTVLAGTANGIPVVGYGGTETRGPILAAGVSVAASANARALSEQILRLVSSEEIWEEQRQNALNAYRTHFSWERIGAQYDELLA